LRLTDFDGYPLPSGLDAWTTRCEKYYASWGRTITRVIGNGPAPNNEGLDCYASFSSNGVVPQKRPLTLLYGDMPVIRFGNENDEQLK
jgi:hypothetical protein